MNFRENKWNIILIWETKKWGTCRWLGKSFIRYQIDTNKYIGFRNGKSTERLIVIIVALEWTMDMDTRWNSLLDRQMTHSWDLSMASKRIRKMETNVLMDLDAREHAIQVLFVKFLHVKLIIGIDGGHEESFIVRSNSSSCMLLFYKHILCMIFFNCNKWPML